MVSPEQTGRTASEIVEAEEREEPLHDPLTTVAVPFFSRSTLH